MKYLPFILLLAGCKVDKLSPVTLECDTFCSTQVYETGPKSACHPGRWACNEDKTSRTCQGESLGSIEVCDGIDNDCDGDIDEVLYKSCTNKCGEQSFFTCNNGSWGECKTEEKTEVCNGKDDDCDGLVDNLKETVLCYTGPAGSAMSGVCHPGVIRCVNGKDSCFGQQTPSAEVCDTLDNDCDDLVDDGLGKEYDIVVVIDDSCSMGHTIGDVQKLFNTVSQYYTHEDYKFALFRITDSVNDGLVLLKTDFTSFNDFNTYVQRLNIGNGGVNEANLDVLPAACDNWFKLKWRTNSRKQMIVFTDEEAQSYIQTITAQQGIDMCNNLGVRVSYFINLNFQVGFNDQASKTGGKIFDIYDRDNLESNLRGLFKDCD